MPNRGNCLAQSLTLWWLLRRRGLAPQLALGAAHHNNEFSARAWVGLVSSVLNDRVGVALRYRMLSAPPQLHAHYTRTTRVWYNLPLGPTHTLPAHQK